MSSNVFLTECSDFGEARVLKSFLESQGFHPKVRDEQTRSVAPHLQNFLGKLIIEIPESEFMGASQALELLEKENSKNKPEKETPLEEAETMLRHTQDMAKKALMNSILGCILIPLFSNLYSMVIIWRVLMLERPLSRLSGQRLILAILFNSLGLYLWLTIGFNLLKSF